ncbi:ChbG/HpnK family deacetylase [Pseudoduganella violaceinigra]|uniref:ChbG/HpnK family deacetylase n=1 Tax=Pseudoduganella violaceinigra TaxID=246602 RepID=UPI00040B3F46|nr:ChbG/HpnK family deacetylase [Pseudoduganella violaceinigra]
MKSLIINAEDVGMHPAVDDAVAELVGRGIVSAASVMALGRPNRETLGAIARQGADLGLHLDFTSEMARAAYRRETGLPSLMLAAWSGTLNAAHVRAALEGQFQRFGELTGRLPDFIDGHQHVHQFPVIREALVQLLERHGAKRIRVRNTASRRWRGGKAAVIGMLGSASLARRLERIACRSNADFMGVYDRSAAADLAARWYGWLASAPAQGGLAMCHPALKDWGGAAFRVKEYQFLGSQQFRELCSEFDVQPVNWRGHAMRAAQTVT